MARDLWEYRIERIPPALDQFAQLLRTLGREGWEAFSIDEQIAYLKRRLPDRTDPGN
jgi:hypothetical protein